MNSILGKSTGIALLLAAGLLAALFAMGVFSATGVGANSKDGDLHNCYGQGIDSADKDKVDGNHNTKVISSCEPGAAVRVELTSFSATDEGKDITVDLTGFGVPDTIEENKVLLSGIKIDANPSEVSVDGQIITVTVPFIAGEEAKANSVIIKQSAGITNPTTAGAKTIKIGDKEYPVSIERVIKLSKSSGTRGTMVEVTGKGFASGTSTVYLQQLTDSTADNNGKINSAGGVEVGAPIQLGSATTADGTFTLTIDTASDDFETGVWSTGKVGDVLANSTKMGVNRIMATDSAGTDANLNGHFQITGKVDVSPASVAKAGSITIKISDWTAGDVTGVKIGGVDDCNADVGGVQECFLADDGTLSDSVASTAKSNDADAVKWPTEDVNHEVSDEKATIKVKVPTSVPLGTQQVAVYTGDGVKSGTGEINVVAQELTVSPTTVARGQSVSISGSGFTPNGNNTSGEISRITVGGEPVPTADNIGSIDVVSGGNVNFIVTIPKNTTNLRDGKNTLLVTAWNGGVGSAEVDIAKAAITLDPPTSRRGTQVSVTGTGFFAGDLVIVEYLGSSPKRVGSALADSAGGFSFNFDVPNVAEIGKAQKVTATADITDGQKITASAMHTTPDAMITVSPGSAAPGSSVTISGVDFPLYTSVGALDIDGLSVLPVPLPITKADGSFSATVVVPQAEKGDRTVLVTVGTTTKTAFITISDAVPAAVTDPGELFAELGARLLRVWEFDNATQQWSFYDPRPDRADFNSLTEVSSGDIATIIISSGAPIAFQGTNLYPGGTSVVVLK